MPRVAGTRLRVQDIVALHLAGHHLSELEAAYPTYSRSELLSALAYYYDHQSAMDALMEAHRESAAASLAEAEARQRPSKPRNILRARAAPP